MALEEVLKVMEEAEREGLTTVRLHTGDPSIYGAIREQMEELEKRDIAYDVTPGVSSFCGAAAALGMEYTLPGISQSVILTRMEGRTKVPEKETIESFAAHQATMVLFLSSGMIGELAGKLVEGGYAPQRSSTRRPGPKRRFLSARSIRWRRQRRIMISTGQL